MNTIIIFSSMTGTTEQMAYALAEQLVKSGEQVVVKDAFDAFGEELPAYERILLGCPTWGDGDLSDEFIDFYEEMVQMNLTGKKAAAFGPGDSSYKHFARAVDILEDGLRACGCDIITNGLKVDSRSSDEQEIQTECKWFVERLMIEKMGCAKR
ncbi:flavodoxin [Robertmurraya siralis]|uniref:Flavodoxin n=1 Tax=Robertmurraya siralis TaxID=77777 RepID=A0A919WI39_9BACI|nr:flavodoxin [Robertmurraya siralis]PAE20415.1 flavodoxin [Bacillus sp. 7504-2]GIN62443.1 flavodoxin [Robertmurraya siralis]